jgi:predicted nucleotidyltransferase
MNADLEKAVAYLDQPHKPDRNQSISFADESEAGNDPKDSDGWKWRYYMAEKISGLIDMNAFSVKGIYLFGSTSSCTARLNSDIDLLIHFDGTEQQKEDLNTWLKGWSMALSEMNYLKTGYQTDGLLDVHYVTDRDIENKDSYATRIHSVYDPAVALRLREDS